MILPEEHYRQVGEDLGEITRHRVRVLERRDMSAPSGGMRVPPNLSKILKRWVGEERLAKVATRCVGTPFHHCEYLPSY